LYSAIRDLIDFQGKNCSWIIVKSICDWADGKKSLETKLLSEAKRQERAASNAAKFVFHVLKQGGVSF
jgi:nucleoside phosphorylase